VAGASGAGSWLTSRLLGSLESTARGKSGSVGSGTWECGRRLRMPRTGFGLRFLAGFDVGQGIRTGQHGATQGSEI